LIISCTVSVYNLPSINIPNNLSYNIQQPLTTTRLDAEYVHSQPLNDVSNFNNITVPNSCYDLKKILPSSTSDISKSTVKRGTKRSKSQVTPNNSKVEIPID
jgi:hypothetical protein